MNTKLENRPLALRQSNGTGYRPAAADAHRSFLDHFEDSAHAFLI